MGLGNLMYFWVVAANLLVFCGSWANGKDSSVWAVRDPDMNRDGLRVAFEAWNFCNEVGEEAPGMASPRAADCFDLSVENGDKYSLFLELKSIFYYMGLNIKALNNPDLYAAEKEIYLGSLCQVSDTPKPWQFWMFMLKNGNYDTKSGLCPENGKKPTSLDGNGIMKGGFNGTYELDSNSDAGNSYFEVVWEKKVGSGS
ncbi:unnamed protein product [Fraxinus pennsylvanica]|uniref:DUF7705 domain-containing protein n=1 Tax=Fraxinus pennsylvanica TaxID=56036 RepID=A0AAD2A028_9LAMI|nr:unnamed protein product [Fraxinus pennsylvanica]